MFISKSGGKKPVFKPWSKRQSTGAIKEKNTGLSRGFLYGLFTAALIFLPFFSLHSDPDKDKFQIQIEDELEDGGTASQDNEKQGEEIIVSGIDEQLIRTHKADTTFISPTDATSMRWVNEKSEIRKDGKKVSKGNEKSGNILAAYGIYDTSFFNLDFTKSDKFGLYRIKYTHENAIAEGFNGAEISNSASSNDELDMSVGGRILPIYTLFFEAKYKGDNVGFQSNPDYRDIFRRWANFRLSNQFKPGNKQLLNLNLNGNYLQSKYGALAFPEANILSLGSTIDLQWIYVFDSKISIEADAAYDYLFLKDMDKKDNHASSVNGGVFLHFPLVRTKLGPSKSVAWQLDLTLGGGGFYKENITPAPTGTAFIDSRLGIWHSRISAEKSYGNLGVEDSLLKSYFEKPLYYAPPQSYANYYWENGFVFNNDNAIKLRLGYRQYDVYYSPKVGSDQLYYQASSTYEESYGRFLWEFSFLHNFLLETAVDINIGSSVVNMRPLYSFLVSLSYETRKLDFAVSLRSVGSRQLDGITLSDYYLLNFSLKLWISPSFAFTGYVENILNQKYMDYYPYQNSGIKLFAGFYVKI